MNKAYFIPDVSAEPDCRWLMSDTQKNKSSQWKTEGNKLNHCSAKHTQIINFMEINHTEAKWMYRLNSLFPNFLMYVICKNVLCKHKKICISVFCIWFILLSCGFIYCVLFFIGLIWPLFFGCLQLTWATTNHCHHYLSHWLGKK